MKATAVFEKWEEVQAYYLEKQLKWRRWIFRGQAEQRWDLKSSLERAAVERFGVAWKDVPRLERRLIREFKRHLHRFADHVPRSDDVIEWLALMQHHGAPTRLLDWTYSFHVAVYFAVERALPGQRCAVFALDHDWCWNRCIEALPPVVRDLALKDQLEDNSPEIPNAVLTTGLPLVYPVNPFALNERLAVQQGVFLAPVDASRSFMGNLTGLAGKKALADRMMKFEVVCSTDFLRNALEGLQKMNINRVSLFPGLDGLAGNLENLISMPHRLGLAWGSGRRGD